MSISSAESESEDDVLSSDCLRSRSRRASIVSAASVRENSTSEDE